MMISRLNRYIINGFIATSIHYAVLSINIKYLTIYSAGLSNFIASIVGILSSYLGCRYFVYNKKKESIFNQSIKFIILYSSIAFFHGLFLFYWTDIYSLDYRFGFFVAIVFQIIFGYSGNKYLVFKY